ncbi:fimbrial protein [Achromobacter insuavis]
MFKKTLLATATTAALLGPVAAFAVGEMGQGTINFTGTIIDAPCSIVAADTNMAIDLGQVALRDLKTVGAASAPVPIVIHLAGCSFDAVTPATNPATYKFSKVAVSFTGATTSAPQGQLANTGTATNIAVQLMGT